MRDDHEGDGGVRGRKLRLRAWAAAIVLPLLLGVLLAAPKKKRDQAPLGVIAGTVFQESGLLLRGARVKAVNKDNPKLKGEAVSDRRGEYAIRVPAVETSYVVTVTAKGFEAQEKTADVYEGQKSITTFRLTPSKSK